MLKFKLSYAPFLVVLLHFMAYGSLAQETIKQDTSATAKSVFLKSTRLIRAGDVLEITVYGHEELPKQIKVEADGTIKYPFMKEVKVDGLTVDQLTNILSVRLTQYIGSRAEIVASFARDDAIEVIVLGQVTKPGAIKIPKNHTIQGAISEAGGATPRSDLDKTKVIRINQESGLREEIEVPIVTIIVETGDIKQLPILREGDVIFVPSIYGAVYANVIGAVGRAGNYELFPGANLVDVLFLAGGPTDDAAIRNIKLIRRIGAAQTEQVVDIESVLQARGGSVPLIQPGDIIFVPAKKFTLKTFFTILGYSVTLLSAYFLFLQIEERQKN